MGPMRVNAFIKRKTSCGKLMHLNCAWPIITGISPLIKRKWTGESINGFEPIKCQRWR